MTIYSKLTLLAVKLNIGSLSAWLYWKIDLDLQYLQITLSLYGLRYWFGSYYSLPR